VFWHTLVIPKAPAQISILPGGFAHVARGGQKIAAAAMKAFKADGSPFQNSTNRRRSGGVSPAHACDAAHNGIGLLPPASRKEDSKVAGG